MMAIATHLGVHTASVLENGALVTNAKLYFEDDRGLMDEVRTALEVALPTKNRRRGIR